MLTAGGKTKMTRKMEAAIAALLTAPTIADAAAAVGVHEQSLWRWLQDPDFKARYRDANREALTQSIARLQQVAGRAVDALESVMDDNEAPANAKVSAAKTVLELAFKGAEVIDLDARLSIIEHELTKRRTD